MSINWCKNIIPTVMTDSFLLDCSLKTYCETPEARKIVDEEGFEFSMVEVLKLEFQNILVISNLTDFISLRRLVLSNNRIEKIAGLDNLVNLVTLDLSFNNIEAIAGLDNLRSLMDLNLAHNKITTIENLDNVKNLRILALNDNNISKLSSVQHLYELKTIRALSLSGNPLAQIPNYKLNVLAFVSGLDYLDYRLVSPPQKEKALATYATEVEELEEKAVAHAKEINERKSSKETNAFYAEALLVGLNDQQFFEHFVSCHETSRLLLTFQPFEEAYNDFCSSFRNICNDWVEMGTKENIQRRKEIDGFKNEVDLLTNNTLNKARSEVYHFTEYKEKTLLRLVLHEMSNECEQAENLNLMKACSSEIDSLWKVLMTLEISLAECINALFAILSNVLPDLVEEFTFRVETVTSQFHQLNSDLKDRMLTFYTDWSEKSVEEKQQIIKAAGSDTGGLDPQQVNLVKMDWPILEEFINEGHQLRQAEVAKKEAFVLMGITAWLQDVMNEIRESELERNRMRVIEIIHCCENAKKELDVVCKHMKTTC